jgi:hypothetical protein
MTSEAPSLAVSSDDEPTGNRNVSSGARTPPTPPVQASSKGSALKTLVTLMYITKNNYFDYVHCYVHFFFLTAFIDWL